MHDTPHIRKETVEAGHKKKKKGKAHNTPILKAQCVIFTQVPEIQASSHFSLRVFMENPRSMKY
jgi:hypothetical protein